MNSNNKISSHYIQRVQKVNTQGEQTATSESRNLFQKMLDKHVDSVQNQKNSSQVSIQTRKESTQQVQQNLPQKTFAESTTPSTETQTLLNNLDKFANQDKIYEKGMKRKTLAESFSSRVGTQERIEKFKHLIVGKAKKYDLDPKLLASLVKQESNFNPYAVSHCGAMGLGQLMPETARYLGVVDPFNAQQNMDGAAKYLKEQLVTFRGNVSLALAAYNAGPGAVKKFGGIPPYNETQNYVKSILHFKNNVMKDSIFVEETTKKSELTVGIK